MKSRPWSSRRRLLEHEAQFARGSRVRYVGTAVPGLAEGTVGTIASDVPTSMDVTPFATPPTVPEERGGLLVEVEFEGVGRRQVALVDLVIAEA